MSGVTSSKRQWASLRVRALAATLLALAMLIPMIGVAMAQDPTPAPAAEWPPYAGANKLCIKGSVINFDETLLPFSDEYLVDDPIVPWQITATPIDPAGGTVVPITVDEDGYFEATEADGLAVGKWTITIALPAGWEMVYPYTASYDITLGYGAKNCTEVRFKLRWPVDVWVYKIDDDHNRLEGWTIRAQPARGNWFASPVEEETDAQGLAVFRLTHGKWIFTERAPDGTHFIPVMPTSGQQEVLVDAYVTPSSKITLRFKNRILTKGCMTITKEDDPPETDTLGPFGLPGWKMTVKRLDGSLVASGVTDALGNVTFNNLPYGPYVVTEEERVGWTSDFATSKQVVISADSAGENDCTEVLFTNKQAPPGFCIEGRKIDANGHIGLPNWVITATAVTKGGWPNPDVDTDGNGVALSANMTTTTDGTGKYVFKFPDDDYRIPGAAYRICEQMIDGWLPHTATCQTVYLPHKPGACVKARDFVNQQVGHSEAMAYGRPSSGGSGCATTHTVAPGESLFGIGNSYGVSGSAMLAANPWVNSRPHRYVYVGDSVCIP